MKRKKISWNKMLATRKNKIPFKGIAVAAFLSVAVFAATAAVQKNLNPRGYAQVIRRITPSLSNLSLSSQSKKQVVLLVWDGAQKRHLEELLNTRSGTMLPNLKALVEKGIYTSLKINSECPVPPAAIPSGDGYKTVTAPGNVALLTGYGKNEMLIADNFTSAVVPVGKTFFERVKVQKPEVVTGLITGKAFNSFPFPPLQNAASTGCCYTSGSVQFCGKANPSTASIDVCKPNGAGGGADTGENSDFLGQQFLDFIAQNKDKSFFLYAHLGEPDHWGHDAVSAGLDNAENSTEYSQALIQNDRILGRIMSQIKMLGLANAVIIVTTDHGFNEGAASPDYAYTGIDVYHQGTHTYCDNDTNIIWAAANIKSVLGKQVGDSRQTSIGATLFDIFEMNTSIYAPFSGESLYLSTR